MVGLDPAVEGEDIPTFPMYRARITNDPFHRIVEDVQAFTFQYGPFAKHDTEESRSCFLSAVGIHPFPHLVTKESTTNCCVYVVLQQNCGLVLWLAIQQP